MDANANLVHGTPGTMTLPVPGQGKSKDYRKAGAERGARLAAELAQLVRDEHAAGRLSDARTDALLAGAMRVIGGEADILTGRGHAPAMVRAFSKSMFTTFRRDMRRIRDQNRKAH